MLSIVKSMSLIGLDGYLINVEVDVSPGMPCFEIVGLPDTSVKESKERVKTAIKNSNLDLLSKKNNYKFITCKYKKRRFNVRFTNCNRCINFQPKYKK